VDPADDGGVSIRTEAAEQWWRSRLEAGGAGKLRETGTSEGFEGEAWSSNRLGLPLGEGAWWTLARSAAAASCASEEFGEEGSGTDWGGILEASVAMVERVREGRGVAGGAWHSLWVCCGALSREGLRSHVEQAVVSEFLRLPPTRAVDEQVKAGGGSWCPRVRCAEALSQAVVRGFGGEASSPMLALFLLLAMSGRGLAHAEDKGSLGVAAREQQFQSAIAPRGGFAAIAGVLVAHGAGSAVDSTACLDAHFSADQVSAILADIARSTGPSHAPDLLSSSGPASDEDALWDLARAENGLRRPGEGDWPLWGCALARVASASLGPSREWSSLGWMARQRLVDAALLSLDRSVGSGRLLWQGLCVALERVPPRGEWGKDFASVVRDVANGFPSERIEASYRAGVASELSGRDAERWAE
jgi:hypothetical protein